MTATSLKAVVVYCGEICKSNECNATTLNLLNRPLNGLEANITVGYEKFVHDTEILSSRIIDLLQLAAYIFCADRRIHRGERNSVSNNSWSRTIEFHLPVIDIEFWSNPALKQALSECLQYMTGDRKYSFVFEKSNLNPIEQQERQLSLFTDETAFVNNSQTADIMLLSGGLDSLAGAIERLNINTDNSLIVINHKANNSVISTQKNIVEYLNSCYGNRVYPYGFECHSKKNLGSVEETQRTRMFLFSSIAYAVCKFFNKNRFYIYENGITSINIPGQADIINARASRTTHPKTIGLVKKFLRFFDSEFEIITPYSLKTKEDVFNVFNEYKEERIISSAVSCSSTRNKPGTTNHCGCCSQCIERKFAAYAAHLEEYDAPYSTDFITDIPDDETNQRLYSILRLASAEKSKSAIDLYTNYPDEITDVIEYWHHDNAENSLAEIYSLFSRFGDSILRGAQAMRNKHEDLSLPTVANSLLALLASREHLKTPTKIRVEEIDKILGVSIPMMFQKEKPKDENDFNNKIKAILDPEGNKFTREYPVIKFGITSYKADIAEEGLIIESKYLRGKSATPSVATEGISADITKIPDGTGLFFVVYDPERKIANDDEFIDSFQNKRPNCFVQVYR